MGWDGKAGGKAGDEPDPGFGPPRQGQHHDDEFDDVESRHGPGLPDAADAADAAGALRDERLARFAKGGRWEKRPPSASLAVVLESLSGPGWRCPGADDGEMVGMAALWAAVESWAGAAKLGVIRELIRREDRPCRPADKDTDVPDPWSESLTQELSMALAASAGSADRAERLAWELGTRLRGIGALLADGTVNYAKAKAIAEAFRCLSDDNAAHAEALIAGRLAGKTHMQVLRLAAMAAARVDPEGTERRRKEAEQHSARVRLWREQSGAAALAGFDLPTDEALAAHENVAARAGHYKASGAFPGAKLDQLRAMAYLDLLNGVTTEARIANARTPASSANSPGPANSAGSAAPSSPGSSGSPGSPGSPGSTDPADPADSAAAGPAGPADSAAAPVAPDGRPGGGPDDDDGSSSDGSSDDDGSDSPDNGRRPDDDGDGAGDDGVDGDPGSGGGGPGRGTPAGPSPRPSPRPGPGAATRPGTDLIIPLATLLGLGNRPGEAYRLGPLDPALCRQLAVLAAASPATELCVTVTDHHGFAIGHGCARTTAKRGIAVTAPVALPARVNLTIRLTDLSNLTDPGGPTTRGSPWAFAPREGDHGPPGGYGSWTLTIPGGRNFTVRLEQVPTFECDHARESHAYQPSDALRHLVQIRDGECTQPTCTRHARECDFEHAVPHHKGGRTCACNAGARSRKCHRIKQSKGWNVTQPKPGYHQWTTPTGRVYTQEPKRYPA